MSMSLEKNSSNSKEYNDEIVVHASESAYQEYKAELELHGSQYMRLRKETDELFNQEFQDIEQSGKNYDFMMERIRERKTKQKRKNLVIKEIKLKLSEIFKMIK